MVGSIVRLLLDFFLCFLEIGRMLFYKMRPMKKYLFLIFVLALGSGLAAQKQLSDVFEKGDVVWFGLDFSQAKFVQILNEQGSETEIVEKWIPAWNNLMVSEPGKYDFAKTFKKEQVVYAIETAARINDQIAPEGLLVSSCPDLEAPEALVADLIKAYDTGSVTEGLGLVFVVTCFNKGTVQGSMYLTFFDIASREVLLCEKMTGRAAGFGIRNYWAGSIYDVLKQVQKKDFKRWRSKYLSK